MIHLKCYLQVSHVFTVILIHCSIRIILSQNLTITPRYQCVNSSVSLNCETLQFASVKWKNGSSIISSSVTDRYTFNQNHTILVIQNITDWDNGSVITCSDGNHSSISNSVTILVYELLDRPKYVRFSNITLTLYTITLEGICDVSLKDEPPVIRYILNWYNLERDILGSSFLLSSCKEDSQKNLYAANFTSEYAVELVSVSAENMCGIGEATNVVNDNSLIAVIPERYVVGQIGQTLTISCVSTHDNSTLEWFQEKVIGTGGKTTVGFFSSNQSITFNVTHSCLGSIFYCTFENHPIYYNVFTELIVLKKPLAFIINGSEVLSEFIINFISSANAQLCEVLCVGTQGNRQLQLHINTTNLSDLMQYSINTQNYSAAIEITIKLTQNLPILFKSTLICTSIESRESVSLIITYSLPVVTVKPASSHAEVTHTVTFTANASGVGLIIFTYQWMHNGSLVTKENGTTLTIANIMESDGGNYSCLVTSIYGETISSNVVTLIVSRNLPVITNNPVDVMIKSNGNISVSFTCEAEGATFYKWERRSGDISSDATGVNATVFTINNIQPNDTGYYRCIASNASGNSFSKYAILELFGCAMETDNIYGLNWPNTKTGELATIRCNTNNATRLCNNNDIWDKVDVSNCETGRYSSLLMVVQSLSNISATPEGDSQIASVEDTVEDTVGLAALLSYYTRPTRNLSILPLDIQNINNILSSFLKISEIAPSILKSGYFINGTANTFSNILDATNAIGWNELLTINELSSQQLLSNSEKFSLQLANHTMFLGIRNMNIIEDNIIISTVAQMDNISDIFFPSQSTVLNSSFADSSGLPYASIVIPSSVLNKASLLHSGSVAVGSVLYRTISRLLPNYIINNRNDTTRIASMVLSTQILGGLSFTQGQDPIELNFQLTQNINSSIDVLCGYFDENVNGSTWSTKGLTVDFSNGSHIRCLSNHLTTFAVLLDLTGSTVERLSSTEIDLLNVFTFIGCSISLICLALTIIILLIFYKSLLKDLHYFVHFNLSIALFMGLAVFLGGIDHAKSNDVACKIVAALLHYFFTAVFTWMMCEGIMIYLLLVKVFNTNITNKPWPFLLIGWAGIPALIVGITFGIAHDGYGNTNNCWLSFERGTIWGFVGPVLLFIVINLIFLIMGVKAALKGRISRHKATNNQEDLNKAKIAKWLLRDTLFLLPMFGITWVFGLLAFNENLSVFAWLFVFFNTTQGLLIFLLYIMKQEKIRNRLCMLFCPSRKPVVFVVKSMPMFHLTKSHKHKAIDPAEITVEVNRYVTDPL